MHVLEGDDGVRDANVTVSLSAPSQGGLTVDYATADAAASELTDYGPVSGTLTFDAGVISQSIPIPITGDGEFEPSEAFSFTLSNPVGARLACESATIRIANDDPGPALSIADVAAAEGDSGERTVFFTVSLSTPSATPVVADWAVMHQSTNDGDVKRKTGSVTIAPGDLVTTMQVVTYPDTTVEPDETYTVTLSNPVNATIAAAQAIGTVLNDDPGVGTTVNVGDAATYEGNAGIRRLKFTVALSDPVANAVTVDYAVSGVTATGGSDVVTNHGRVTIAAGATTNTITVSVKGDAAVEPDEIFMLTLQDPSSGVTLGRAIGTGSILNDD